MTTALDYPQLESLCWRALCRHHLDAREMVVAATVIRLSFGLGQPCLRLGYAVELARLTGMSKGSCHDVVAGMERFRLLEVSDDRRILTFLPPTSSRPWLYKLRVKESDLPMVDELERAIVWAQQGPQQEDYLAPASATEFTGMQAMERLRAELLEAHRASAGLAPRENFPVTDRSPTPAPAERLSSGEGPTRPLETAMGGGQSSVAESLCAETPEESSNGLGPRHVSRVIHAERFSNREPGSQVENLPLRALRASEESKASKPLRALRGGFSNREPLTTLDPGADEEEIMRWLVRALGKPTMDKFGGWWRLRVRESRWAALNVCMELHLRLTDTRIKPLLNPGGWARDQYFKIRGEEAEAKE